MTVDPDRRRQKYRARAHNWSIESWRRHAETEMSLCRIKQKHHTVGGPATDQNIQCGHIKDSKLSTTTGGK